LSPRTRKRGSNRSAKPTQHDRRHRPASGGSRRPEGSAGFWGDPAALPPASLHVRISDDPAAIARSLGPPPLPGHQKIAEHYFAAVYDRAVTLAGALAAAGGLLTQEELEEELEADHRE